MPKASAGRPTEIGTNPEPINRGAPTLAEIGIDKKTSARAQKLAALPDETFLKRYRHRRHLTESQRAMVAAKLANMQQGQRTDLQPSANLQNVSQSDAAQLLNVSTR